MKRKIVFLLLVALAMFADSTFAQSKPNAKVDQTGNYVQVKQPVDTTGVNTGKTYTTSSGLVYPVKVSNNGKLFIIRISKNGKTYKQYLKV